MIYGIRLKTGFYETKPYNLSAGRTGIVLKPAELGEEPDITIPDDEILTLTITIQKLPELEILTYRKAFRCILGQETKIEGLLRLLKENTRNKIICEYGRDRGE